MYVYILSYFFLLLCLSIASLSPIGKYSPSSMRLLSFIGLIPAILLVGLRGDVGTDTATYLLMASDLMDGEVNNPENLNIEFGFLWLLRFLIFLSGEPRFSINVLSLIIAFYSFFIFSKNRESIVIFSLLVFPVLFFDMSMNGLRYGLSFLLAKHASDVWLSNKKAKSLVLLIGCIGLQLSGILVFFLLRLHRLRFLNLIYVLPFAIVFYGVFQGRLTDKFIVYAQLESPSLLSGLLPLAIFFACYLCLLLVDFRFAKRFMPLLILELLSFFLAKFTYAGLRVQLLILFVFFCLISEIDLKAYGQRKLLIVFIFFFIGFIGFIGTLRHYIADADVPPSPFLPYHFFWEEQ